MSHSRAALLYCSVLCCNANANVHALYCTCSWFYDTSDRAAVERALKSIPYNGVFLVRNSAGAGGGAEGSRRESLSSSASECEKETFTSAHVLSFRCSCCSSPSIRSHSHSQIQILVYSTCTTYFVEIWTYVQMAEVQNSSPLYLRTFGVIAKCSSSTPIKVSTK